MNELEKMCSEVRPIDPDVLANGRRRLQAAAIKNERARRPRLLLTGAAAVTGVTVAVAVAVTASSHGGAGGGHPVEATRLSARQVLLAAASTAARQPATTGRYWHTVDHMRAYYPINARTGGYTVVDVERQEEWTPVVAGGSDKTIRQDLGFHPVSAADTAAWRRAGAPRTLQAGGQTLSVKPGPPAQVQLLSQVDQIPASLPSDPARLKAVLLKTDINAGQSIANRLFYLTATLFAGPPRPPAVRAAAFKMLAYAPGITRFGTVDDGEGHAGTAVGFIDKGPGKNGRGHGSGADRIIFDSSTSELLGYSSVVVVPMIPGEHPGDPVDSTTVVSQGWTNSRP